MARIKLDLPEIFIFSTNYTVHISDVNYGGHVGNDAILTIMQEGRMALLKAMNIKDELSIDDGVGIIVADAAVVYKSEGFHGDELEIKIAVDDFNKFGFDMYYQLINAATNKEVARGKTGIVCLNYQEKKITPIPPKFKEKLEQGL
ncbi:acyl-CoA thioesterase [Fulvivirga lutimaris]|uniref:acyl-CoA thioesterase n=1 Tax=Fulvivirga lutimaris TaxID=1819566 RepID=UPI0012BC9B74|nr:thioesterase family protein [Fulvivirga lutimaris]MTI41442.1 thioesterase [Fulvivirga lutimaris]